MLIIKQIKEIQLGLQFKDVDDFQMNMIGLKNTSILIFKPVDWAWFVQVKAQKKYRAQVLGLLIWISEFWLRSGPQTCLTQFTGLHVITMHLVGFMYILVTKIFPFRILLSSLNSTQGEGEPHLTCPLYLLRFFFYD